MSEPIEQDDNIDYFHLFVTYMKWGKRLAKVGALDIEGQKEAFEGAGFTDEERALIRQMQEL